MLAATRSPLRFSNPVHLLSAARRSLSVAGAMSLKRKDPPTSSAGSDAAKKPKKNADLTSFFGPPKAKPTGGGVSSNAVLSSITNGVAGSVAADPAPVKFDKDKWVAGLTEEQRGLLKLEIDTLDPSWLAQLKDEVVSREFLDLKRFLQKEIDGGQKIYPPLEDVYSWYDIVLLSSRDLGSGR